MRTLNHKELLEFEPSKTFPQKGNEYLLADYLTKSLYGAKLSDFPQHTEAFQIVGRVATLTINKDGSMLTANRPELTKLVDLFRAAVSLKRKLRTTIGQIAQTNPGELISCAFQSGISDLKLVSDDTYKARLEKCNGCRCCSANRCVESGFNLVRLKLATTKCPFDLFDKI